MFVAIREMRRLRGRFALLAGAIALLVVLLLFFQAVAGALQAGLTDGFVNNDADVFVYSDKARRNPSASFLPPQAVDPVSKIDGVAMASGVVKAQFTVEGSDADVATIGLEDPQIGGPAEISEGRLPATSGEALAANPGLSSTDLRFNVGDNVTVEGVAFKVVGLAKDAQFDVGPTLYVLADDVHQMNSTKAGQDVPPLLSWIAVVVEDGNDPQEVADRISDQVDLEGLAGPPAGQRPVQGGPPPGGAAGAGGQPPPPSPPTGSAPPSPQATPTTPSTPTSATSTGAPGTAAPDTAASTDSAATATTVPAESTPTSADTVAPPDSVPAPENGDGGPPPGAATDGPPGGPPDAAQADNLPSLSTGVEALDRENAAANLPGVDQISQSFNILYLLLFIVVTIVTGVFFLILTVQKQDSLVLMRALGASRSDAVRPVLIEVLVVVGIGSAVGVVVAGGLLYLSRSTFGAGLDATTTVVSVAAILVLGVLASFGSVRRVLKIDPVQAARRQGK